MRRAEFSDASRDDASHFLAHFLTNELATMFSLASTVVSVRAAAPSVRLGRSRRASFSRASSRVAQTTNRRSVSSRAVTSPAGGVSAPAADANADIADFLATQMVDEAAMLAASTFPIAPEVLIASTKRILAKNNGAGEPNLLASDFKFVAPVVGPLPKDDFLKAFASFKLEDAFPDAFFGYYAFRVDPFETNRVWFDARFTGTNTGMLAGSLEATGKKVEAPPQSCSMLFNKKGECTQLTVGYVMDKTIGNTGGLGGVFGILYAIGYGLPFPEAQPWQKSIQYSVFNNVSGFVAPIQKFVKGLSGGE